MTSKLKEEKMSLAKSTNSNKKTNSKRKAGQILEEFFLRSGYLRIRNENQLEEYGSQKYKKGFEIRFVARNINELELIRNSITALSYKLSKSYISNNRFIQPLYGKEITLKFKKIKERNNIITASNILLKTEK